MGESCVGGDVATREFPEHGIVGLVKVVGSLIKSDLQTQSDPDQDLYKSKEVENAWRENFSLQVEFAVEFDIGEAPDADLEWEGLTREKSKDEEVEDEIEEFPESLNGIEFIEEESNEEED